ncbi:ATP-binding protein [Robiginitalea biformata]|uniref:histidine kinase n=1 Tax=Robiginitalea biformata (strain ATCC BAA-864 / DSM 15991 / KCTC 12146 / HTCC2501) TaxID=313596 RepID=A4CIV4_ROBBH|nr:ATP-binding protein [Robiginitalea biformata]EAR16862.1 putative two-component system sensor histidine kinase/response regulator fusion protein [Robiginitalea biformata HTCC2501]
MKREGRFTLKLLLSYLSLIVLAGITGYAIYNEVAIYFREDAPEAADMRLVRVGGLISRIYEAESAIGSRLAPREEDFEAYSRNVDSIRAQIQDLKEESRLPEEFMGLDSIQGLLEQQVRNTRQLLNLSRQEARTDLSIGDALAEFNKIQESLGRFQAENLFPGFQDMSPQVQQSLREYADLLSRNAPQLNDKNADPAYLDSILSVSKGLLEQARASQRQNQQSRQARLEQVRANNQELSGQIRSLLGSLEQEVRAQSLRETLRRRETLRDTIRLAGGAALLGLVAVVIFAFFIHRDIDRIATYRRKLEKEKQYSESLLRSRERLIASVSHDLRSPLNTIQGYGELLGQTELSEKQAAYTAAMDSASRYLERLANDLLDFSRLEAGQLKTEELPFIPAELIRETCHSIEAANRTGRVALELDLERVLDTPCLGDSFRVRQILSNLLGNAYKFTREGTITVSGRLRPSGNGGREGLRELEIRVSDTGMGIREENLESIFQEFTQAEADAGAGQKGYGLGLTISRKLSELLGGSLTARSTWGRGSTFTLRVPVTLRMAPGKEDPGATGTPGKKREAAANGTTPLPAGIQSVLVIDDDPSLCAMLDSYCETLGIRCLTANGYPSLPRDASLSYDVVVTDIELPETDGFSGLKMLRDGAFDHYRGQPVIAMSGRRDLERDTAVEAGFSDLLHKPFSIREFAACLGLGAEVKPEVSDSGPEPDTPEPNTPEPGTYMDTRSLEQFLGPDPGALRRVLETFYHSTLKSMGELQAARDRKDPVEMSRIAHRVLPMFRQLGLQQAASRLSEIEAAGESDPLDMARASQALDQLDPTIGSLLEKLRRDLREPSAYTD